ncbi:fumarylacetoacetate hydrolase family protein [Paracoccus sp. (in: a-proteobacteria)]|uniref:fumarylacetoacetate hydrolase family protein n=1 Tax=Paracoccus sp. TaxID=267 RepID=UPI00396C66B6
MSGFVIAPPPMPSIPVHGRSERFPVRRIFCVGRNYADHAREMGHDPDREPPFFFSKPADALLTDGADLPYPSATKNLHFEAELVVALGAGGANVAPKEAGSLIWGFAAGNDLTRRDLQAEAKRMGRPWDMAKGFDHSALCGTLHPVQETGPMAKGRMMLEVNGIVRQDCCLSQMIWPVPDIIAALSRMVCLSPSDLIYSGTPAGVGAVVPGDRMIVRIEGLEPLINNVVLAD